VSEFQSLGAVSGEQQQAALAAAHVPGPLSQPLDEVFHGSLDAASPQCLGAAGF